MLGEISACCGIPRNYRVDSHLLHKKVSKNLLAVYGSPCSDGAVEEVGRRPWPEGSSVLQWIILQTQAQRGMPFAAVIGPTDRGGPTGGRRYLLAITPNPSEPSAMKWIGVLACAGTHWPIQITLGKVNASDHAVSADITARDKLILTR